MSDAPGIFFQRSDENMIRYLDRAPAKSIDEASTYIKNIIESESKNESISWALTLKGQNKLIGTISFWRIVFEHYRAEIGYVLHTNYQGKGLMQEAMESVLHYGFSKMKLHSVEANVNPSNVASIKLLERNGFVKEAHFKENYFYNGQFLDSAIYSLIATDSK
jgi:ribosomal-protein-alanine N-acetyltransferase